MKTAAQHAIIAYTCLSIWNVISIPILYKIIYLQMSTGTPHPFEKIMKASSIVQVFASVVILAEVLSAYQEQSCAVLDEKAVIFLTYSSITTICIVLVGSVMIAWKYWKKRNARVEVVQASRPVMMLSLIKYNKQPGTPEGVGNGEKQKEEKREEKREVKRKVEKGEGEKEVCVEMQITEANSEELPEGIYTVEEGEGRREERMETGEIERVTGSEGEL